MLYPVAALSENPLRRNRSIIFNIFIYQLVERIYCKAARIVHPAGVWTGEVLFYASEGVDFAECEIYYIVNYRAVL